MTDRERDEWIKVAEALGVKNVFGVGLTRAQAMLHGLACLRCNGAVMYHTAKGWEETTGWVWESHDLFQKNDDEVVWEGEADSHPAALLAMLEAHADG